MLSFIRQIRGKLQAFKSCPIVLGNEALDLDSAVCSVAFAHHLNCKDSQTIPILNVNRDELPLKTEVMYCFKKFGIDPMDLICKDEFDFRLVESVTLVDHHVLSKELEFLKDKVVEIVDHRHLKGDEDFTDIVLKHELVGSCSSLVADILLNSSYDDSVGLKLLYISILVDTMNLDKSTNVVARKDIESVERIEALLDLKPQCRKTEFDAVMKAKNDIRHFTTIQLLKRDLKVIYSSNKNNKKGVALSSIMMSIKGLMESRADSFLKDLSEYRKKNDFKFLVLTGLHFPKEIMTRDMIIFSDEPKVIRDLKNRLLGIELFQLSIIQESFDKDSSYVLFAFGNGTIPRKKLLPHVNDFLNDQTDF